MKQFLFSDLFYWIHGLVIFTITGFKYSLEHNVITLFIGVFTILSFMTLMLPNEIECKCILHTAYKFNLNPKKIFRAYRSKLLASTIFINYLMIILFWTNIIFLK